MNRYVLATVVALLATSTLAQEPRKDVAGSGPWLKVVKSTRGYLVGGRLEGVFYAFEVPGSEIKSVGEGKPPMMVIDGVLLQVLNARKSEFASFGPDALEAQKRYEQKFQQEHIKGVVFSDHDFCKGAAVRHGHWTMEVPPMPGVSAEGATPYQAFITFEVGNFVLVVGSAYGKEVEKQAVASKFRSICTSFRSDR